MEDRRQVHTHLRRVKRFEAAKLRDISQLPDLTTGSVDFDLSLRSSEEKTEHVRREQWFVITQGDRVIWRELAWFESPTRYRELLAVLRAKFGASASLRIVGDETRVYLLGDRYSSADL